MTQASNSRAISLLLEGYSITGVATMLGVSRTTIYNRRREFLNYVEKEGIGMAADKFDVQDNIEELFNLARELKQNNLRVDEAKKGSEISALINNLGMDDSIKFIEEVMIKANEFGLTGKEITDYSLQLRTLQEKEGKTYPELIHEINNLRKNKEKAEDDFTSIREKIKLAKNELDESLLNSETTGKQLKSYVEVRDNLIQNGIEIEDLISLKNIIHNMREHNYDINEVINFYSDTRISKNDLERNNKENTKLIEHNKSLFQENYALEKEITNNLSMASAVDHLIAAKIKPEDILYVANTVTGMVKIHGLTNDEALDKFINDIKTSYTERTQYEFDLTELDQLRQNLLNKNDVLKEQLEVLEEVLNEKKKTVESLNKLETLGVSNAEIVEWGQIVKDLEYDLSFFREAILSLGGIPEYVKKKTEQIILMEIKEKELEKNIQVLEEKINVLSFSLSNASEAIDNNIIKINTSIQEFETYFLSPDTGFKTRNISMVNEIFENIEHLLSQTKAEWCNDLDQLNFNVEKIVEETSRILENAYRGGRIVGNFHSLEPIHKILREEHVPITEGTISVITLLTYIKIWLKKNYPLELDSNLNSIISKLTEDLGDIY